MESHWWTIVIRAMPYEQTESGLIIRLVRAADDGTATHTFGSIDAAVRQVKEWLDEFVCAQIQARRDDDATSG